MKTDYNFQFKQLISFLEIINEGSFTRASRKLKIGQATISHHITRLEEMTGVTLINRRGTKVSLTDEGAAFREFCLSCLGNVETLKLKINTQSHPNSLRIAASTIPSTYILPPVLADIRKEHPNFELDIEGVDSREGGEIVKEGGIEAAIVGSMFRHPALSYQAVYNDEIVLIAPPDYPDSISIDELKSFPLIVREFGSGTRRVYEEELLKLGVLPSALTIAAHCSTTEMAKELVAAGVGCSFVSSLSILNDVALKRLKCVKVHKLSIKRKFYCVRQKKQSVSWGLSIVMEYLNKRFEQE